MKLNPGCCGCAGCSVSGTVLGCVGLPLQGATVVVNDLIGNVLGSARTDAGGRFSIAGLASGTRYTLTVSSPPRFQDYTTSFTCPGTGGAALAPITLTPSAGYHCWNTSNCVYPLADTIYATDSTLGSATLTYQSSGPRAGQWYAQTIHDYPGYTQDGRTYCQPGPVAIAWLLNAIDWDCYSGSGIQICPVVNGTYVGAGCGGSEDESIARDVQCPPAFSIDQTIIFTGSTSSTADQYAALYGLMTADAFSILRWSIPAGTLIATRSWTE